MSAKAYQMPDNRPGRQGVSMSMATVRWIVALLLMLLGLVATSVAWKTNTDDHLERMEEHMQNEDKIQLEENRKLDWLIRHNKDGNEAPMNWDRPSDHGEMLEPLALIPAPLESQIPPLYEPNR